jgi:hypothetical protein
MALQVGGSHPHFTGWGPVAGAVALVAAVLVAIATIGP